MKIRNGFVSNSSSSSFMICLKAEDYNEVYKTLSPLEQELVNHLRPENKKVFGLNLKIISGTCGNYDSFEDFETNIEDLTEEEQDKLEEGPSCMFDDVLKKFRKKDNFEHGVDF